MMATAGMTNFRQQASYRTPGDTMSPRAPAASQHTSDRADARRRNENAHFAAEQFEQHSDTPVVCDPIDHALVFREHAVSEPDRAARLQAGRQTKRYKSVLALAGADFLDHSIGDRE